MQKEYIKKHAFAMPFSNPAYPRGPYRFINREYLVITYETELELLKEIVPAPLEVKEPYVKFEIIRMPDSTGFGDYTESGQVIPITYKGEAGTYTHSMYLDDHPPIAAGREIWGFPKKLASPHLIVEHETLLGTLDYGSSRVATASMGYKYAAMDCGSIAKDLAKSNYLLKIIPHIDGTVRICELVAYNISDITIKGAWSGPAQLELFHHALAPLAQLPVKRVMSGVHFISDLTLPYGRLVHNYL